jgi:hypothetical protein
MTKITISCNWPLLIDFDLQKAETYLLSKGWTEVAKWGQFGRIFVKGSHRLMLPTIDTIGDFRTRISEFINDLSLVENLPPWELVKNLEVQHENG